jgi:tetratricopeptide (TPR) repeat protein
MYWWSNIAVPERSDTRLLVPAESAYCLGCEPGQLTRVPVPEYNGVDYSYSTNVSQAADFFFDLPDGQYPWIAALDGDGKGLVQISTSQLKGRKLWVWGQGHGGRNWQKFLSPPGQGYIEIQAGLTRTQLEHQRMPAGESWSWLEAYGLLETDPDIVHGSEWGRAWRHAEHKVHGLISVDELAAEHKRRADFENVEPIEFYQLGSGWGALENRLQKHGGEQFQLSPGLIFGEDAITQKQMPWTSLLENGEFPDGDPNTPPAGFVVNTRWGELLETALLNDRGSNWLAWYHAGLIRYHAGDQAGARQAWEKSLALSWTPWTARNLAHLSWNEGEVDQAADLLLAAQRAAPDILSLAVECGRCLLESGRPQDWLSVTQKMSASQRANGRLRLLEAQASLDVGDLDVVDKFFNNNVVVADLREGESSLTDLWFQFQAMKISIAENIPLDDDLIKRVERQVSVPSSFDFRMKSGIGV